MTGVQPPQSLGPRVRTWWAAVLAGVVDEPHPLHGADVRVTFKGGTLGHDTTYRRGDFGIAKACFSGFQLRFGIQLLRARGCHAALRGLRLPRVRLRGLQIGLRSVCLVFRRSD